MSKKVKTAFQSFPEHEVISPKLFTPQIYIIHDKGRQELSAFKKLQPANVDIYVWKITND